MVNTQHDTPRSSFVDVENPFPNLSAWIIRSSLADCPGRQTRAAADLGEAYRPFEIGADANCCRAAYLGHHLVDRNGIADTCMILGANCQRGVRSCTGSLRLVRARQDRRRRLSVPCRLAPISHSTTILQAEITRSIGQQNIHLRSISLAIVSSTLLGRQDR
jgi:hypothetical protein